MKKILASLLLTLCCMTAAAQYSHTVQAEQLGRGLVAVTTSSGVYLSWRSLVTDDSAMAFDVYRDGEKITTTPISSSTNYTDANGTATATYTVKALVNNEVVETSESVTPWTEIYKKVHLDRPEGGTSPSGGTNEQCDYTYTPDDVSVGDVDGDGEYELIVKWFPTNQADNSYKRYTGKTLLDCYKLDGTKLWRIDLGINIRSGNHYTQFLVYDFDGDGKAELMCKTAPGTVDGLGNNVIMDGDDATKDYRNSSGIIMSGPEYLTVFNGETGAEIATIQYNPLRSVHAHSSSGWGDNYANRCERYLAAVAYLDGEKPSAVFCRGYYTQAYLWAVDFDGKNLTERWLHASTTKSSGAYGEGAHSLTVGDVDGDGKDEITYGACAIDDDGTLLYRTGAGHGDALHLADMDPTREGLEVFMVHEEKTSSYKWDAEMRDAATGEIIWGAEQSGNDIGRGLAANISSTYPGYEAWFKYYGVSSSGANSTFDCQGNYLVAKSPSINFRIYWDGDLLDELFDGKYSSDADKSYPIVEKRNNALTSSTTLLSASSYSNAGSCNTTKATPNLQADLFGDWREELILHDQDTESDLLIFTTTIATDYKVTCLMQDRQYREAIAWQNVAYNQPPHLSYNLEDSFNQTGSISITSGNTTQVVNLGEAITPIEFLIKRATGVEATGLPDGVTVTFDAEALTGVVSGTPTADGEFDFTITTTGAADGNGSVSGTIKVKVSDDLTIIAQYSLDAINDGKLTNTVYGTATQAGDGASIATGMKNGALSLTGSTYFSQNQYDELTFGSDAFTIELWFNSTASAATLLHIGTVKKDEESSYTGNWIGVELKNGELRFAIDDDDDDNGYGKTQLADTNGSAYFDGNWHHYVAVRDAYTKALYIYVDGVLTADCTDNTGAIYTSDVEPLVIGNLLNGSNYYVGMLDEITIYKGAMTAAQVLANYEAMINGDSGIKALIADGMTRCTVVDAMTGIVVREAIGNNADYIVNNLARGLYILVVEQGNTTKTYKFVR